MTMNLSCPLCGSGQYDIVYEKLAYFPDADIVKCRQCGHLYTLIIKEVDTRDLYSDAVYKVVENRDSIYDRILNREYRGVIRQINSFNREKGKLLDFGSGKGKFGMLPKKTAGKSGVSKLLRKELLMRKKSMDWRSVLYSTRGGPSSLFALTCSRCSMYWNICLVRKSC